MGVVHFRGRYLSPQPATPVSASGAQTAKAAIRRSSIEPWKITVNVPGLGLQIGSRIEPGRAVLTERVIRPRAGSVHRLGRHADREVHHPEIDLKRTRGFKDSF
jgi:hypothetical protein